MRAVTIAIVLVITASALAQPPSCDSLPLLERYDQLTPNARFRLALQYDATSRSWIPTPALEHTLHHADAFDFGAFTFPTTHEGTMVVEATSLERVLREYDDTHHTWFFVHRVRVERVCS